MGPQYPRTGALMLDTAYPKPGSGRQGQGALETAPYAPESSPRVGETAIQLRRVGK